MDSEKKVIDERTRRIRKKRTKTIIWIIIIGCLLLFGIYSYNFRMANGRWPWKQEGARASADAGVLTTTVYRSFYDMSIDISGSVVPYDIQNVQMRASGAVTGVYVKEGDSVTKGQLLAEIDDTDQQYAVASYERQLKSARLSGNSSASDIELLEKQLDSAKKKLDNTKAHANFNGVVSSVSINKDDYYDVGKVAMTIIDVSLLKATVEVDEIDVQLVKVGTPVTLTSDSTPGVSIPGHVSYIPMVGRYSAQGIGVMDVEILVENPPSSLRPGFSFEGTIDIDSQTDLLLVSQDGITTSGGKTYATRQNADGTTETVEVLVKYLGENLYQVLSGLNEGDVVLCNTARSRGMFEMFGMSSYGSYED